MLARLIGLLRAIRFTGASGEQLPIVDGVVVAIVDVRCRICERGRDIATRAAIDCQDDFVRRAWLLVPPSDGRRSILSAGGRLVCCIVDNDH